MRVSVPKELAEVTDTDAGVWTKYAAQYESLDQLWPYRAMVRDVLKALGLQTGLHLLDVGCGPGLMRRAMEESGQPLVHYTGVDNNLAMLERARAAHYSDARFLQADLTASLMSWNFGGPFERVLLSNVLYAMSNPGALLRKLRRGRISMHHTRLVISTPIKGARLEALVEAQLMRSAETQGIDPDVERLGLLERFAEVIAINRQLLANPDYFFPDERELRELFANSGWRITAMQKTYADQNWLVTAE